MDVPDDEKENVAENFASVKGQSVGDFLGNYNYFINNISDLIDPNVLNNVFLSSGIYDNLNLPVDYNLMDSLTSFRNTLVHNYNFIPPEIDLDNYKRAIEFINDENIIDKILKLNPPKKRDDETEDDNSTNDKKDPDKDDDEPDDSAVPVG